MNDPRIGFSFFFTVLFVVFPYIFYRHRFVFPVKGRDPRLMVLVGIMTGIAYFNNAFLWSWYPCALKVWVYVYSINGSYLFYTIRTWNLLFRYEITDNLGRINQAKREGKTTEELSKMEGWYLRHRYLMRPKNLALWIILDYLVQTLYLLYATVKVDPPIRMRENCELFPASVNVFTWNTYLFGPRAIIVAWLAWHLKSKVVDSFRMKRELKFLGIVVLLDVILVIIIQKAAPTVSNTYHLQFWIGCIAAFASIPFGFIVPVYDHYRYRDEQLAVAQNNLTHLSGVLSSETGFKALLDFLTTEFSTENLFCWRECHEFYKEFKSFRAEDGALQSANIVEAYGRAKEIYDTYIDPAAKYEVNLGSEMRNKMRLDLDALARSISSFCASPRSTTLQAPSRSSSVNGSSPDSSVIDATVPLARKSENTETEAKERSWNAVVTTVAEIRKSLYDLMNDDSFKRFLTSDIYKQLQSDVKQHFLSQKGSDISDEMSKFASGLEGTQTRSGSSAQDDAHSTHTISHTLTMSRPYRKNTDFITAAELQMADLENLPPPSTPISSPLASPQTPLTRLRKVEESSQPEKPETTDLILDPEMTSSRDGLI